jgi:Ser/Thr protein kinase RdoA (MazF antagonist)
VWGETVAWVRAHHGDADLPAGVSRLSGGYNNGLYAVGDACVKLYRVDERRRWEREWRALTFLAERGAGLAPRPLWFDPDGSPPAVVMERLTGDPLHERPIGPAELEALGEALSALHRAPGGDEYPTTVIGTPARFVEEVTLAAERLDGLVDDPLAGRSAARLRGWLASDDRELLAAPAPPVFAHGDTNPANYLWDGRRVRFVDFEYAGRSDAAFDLGDLVEHVGAQPVAEEAWAPLLARFGLDAAGRRRLKAARRLAAHFWLTILWRPALGRPEDRIETQLRRVEQVLDLTR